MIRREAEDRIIRMETRAENEGNLKRTTKRVEKGLMEIDDILEKPFNLRRQNPLEGKFKGAAKRTSVVSKIEEELGSEETPNFLNCKEEWLTRRETAVGMGYTIETFEAYLIS